MISPNEVQHYCISTIICGSITETSFSVIYISDSYTLEKYVDNLRHVIMAIVMITIIMEFYVKVIYWIIRLILSK